MALNNVNNAESSYENKLEEKEREVEELRAMLLKEREFTRQWRDAASKATHEANLPIETLLPISENSPAAALTIIESQPPPCSSSFVALPIAPLVEMTSATLAATTSGKDMDLKRMMGTSIIREIGVEKHFMNVALSVGESRRNISSTSVQVKELSLSYTAGQTSKAFPSVGEALMDPFISLVKTGKRGKQSHEIKALQHITTALAPQNMYLLVGGPKAGKTCLLKAIAGRSLKGKGFKMSGKVSYNGESAESGRFHMVSLACFVGEADHNEPLLTVRETLEFSGACIAPVPTRSLLETSYGKALIDSLNLEESIKEDLRNYRNVGQPKVRRALAQQKAKVVMALLGLNGCANTIIGDAAHRGISGGERRRVTLAEVLMGEYSIAAFDEISNGLDSAATFDIVRMIRASVDAFNYCCVISLNQPAPEVFELFDEILVLKNGALVYQGPPDEAKDYFEGIGFHCPPKTDVADFLIRVTGPDNRKWRASTDELVEAGLSASFVGWPRSTNEFVSRFRKSDAGKALFAKATRTMTAEEEERQQRLASLSEDDSATINTSSNASTTLWKENEKRQFFNSWTTSFIICMQRELTLTFRDRSYIISRIMQDIFLGVLTGAIFWQLDIEAVATRFGALYQSLLTVAFQTAACIPAYFVRRRVFYKQKNAGFFSCSSYLLASTFAASPLVLLDSVLFGTIVYWCAGFARDDHGLHFFVFLAHLTFVGWAMMSFFKLTTFLSPNLTSAAAISGIVTFFLLLFSGFIISITDVPSFYVWVMYLNPLFYAFQGLAVNEFIAEKYSLLLPSGRTLGETVLSQKGMYTDARWAWWGLLVNLSITLLYLTLTQLAMTRLEWLEPINSADTTPEEAITQGSLAMRELGASRRNLNVKKANEEGKGEGEGGIDSDDERTWASESVRSWDVGSSIDSSNIWLRSFNTLGDYTDDDIVHFSEAKEDEASGDPPNKQQLLRGSASFVSSVDCETKDAELETEKGAENSSQGVKFSSQVFMTPNDEEEKMVDEVQKTNEALRPLPTTMTSTMLLDQLKRGKSSTWQLEAVKAIPFVPTALTFQNLWYSVPVKGNETVDLLKGVNGSVVPGCMMALMGSSGAGKTTLLDVLAGRKTGGSIRGSILVNGVALSKDVFKTITGYVEQFGSVSPYMTVSEALQFNAELRMPEDVTYKKKEQFVHDVIRILELEPIASAVVGPPGAGLSFEELKRVTIGCEVVANPSLIFLDEPTTGLDGRAALMVVRVMRKLAHTGRAIICTIHQPSQEIFNFFDSLLLLKRGGQTVFCGPLGSEAAHLKDYFLSIPGTPPLQPGENPATWCLECLGAGTGMGTAVLTCDYASEWKASAMCASNLETLEALMQPPSDAQLAVMASVKSRKRASFGRQLAACTRRAWRSLWRMPEYQIARVLGCGVMGLILGSLYFRQTQDSVSGLVSFIALLFLATTCISNINSTAVLQVVALEKTSFCRERYNQMYQVAAYTLSWFLCEIPWVFLQTIVYTITFYPTCNYNLAPWRTSWFFGFSFMYLLFSTAFGQAIGAVCPSVQVAQIVLNCLVPIFSMMSGMVIIPRDLPPGWKFLWVLTPLNKAFEGLVVTQWYGDDGGAIGFFNIRHKEFEVLTRWEFVNDFFETFTFEHRFRNLGVLFLFVAICNLGYYLALKYRKLENR